MADVINLNDYRKKREKAIRAKRAIQNRARHGLTKSERLAEKNRREREARELDNKKLGAPDEGAENSD